MVTQTNRDTQIETHSRPTQRAQVCVCRSVAGENRKRERERERVRGRGVGVRSCFKPSARGGAGAGGGHWPP